MAVLSEEKREAARELLEHWDLLGARLRLEAAEDVIREALETIDFLEMAIYEKWECEHVSEKRWTSYSHDEDVSSEGVDIIDALVQLKDALECVGSGGAC